MFFTPCARCSWRYKKSAQALLLGGVDNGAGVDASALGCVGSPLFSVCISGVEEGVWSGVGSRVLSKSNKPKGDMKKNLSNY